MNATDFMLYNNENAPEGSADLLSMAESKFGFVPNVLRQIAAAPAALGGTLQLMGALEKSSLTPVEQWTALLVVAFQNTSSYCVAANSTVAQMMGVPADVVAGVRSNKSLADPKLEALRLFTTELVRKRGQVTRVVLEEFLDAGYTKQQVFEVILAIALETIASYTDGSLATPMDEQFQASAWTYPATA